MLFESDATQRKRYYKIYIFFFYFECSQDEKVEYEEGYQPLRNGNCKYRQSQQVCKSYSKFQHCKTLWCGKATHCPNFVVAYSVCPHCIDKPPIPKSVCRKCSTRFEDCDNSGLWDNEDEGPYPTKCGFREVTFEGADISEKFGEWLFTDQHEHFKVVAHNMKGYDDYFLLEYLIDQAMRPEKIIYNGSKNIYMTVEGNLHIKVIDSRNLLPMKLSALPKAFGLEVLKKEWFPHHFNTRENQNLVGPYPEATYYRHDFMGEKERNELLEWLSERKNEAFDFRKGMLDYCRSDIEILTQARELLMSATGVQREVINDKEKKEMKWFGLTLSP